MAPKFGNYLFRNLKGESADSSTGPGREASAELIALEDRAIVLHETDFLPAADGLPVLDWSQSAQRQICIQVKDTRGIMEGRAGVSAAALRRVCPGLLPPDIKDEALFLVSLKAVVLQIQSYLSCSPGELVKSPGPDFDTPIAQVAREDEGFLKLENAAQSVAPPGSPSLEKAVKGPVLTPADRPPFPLIREKPRNEPPAAETGTIEVTLPPVSQLQSEGSLEGKPKIDPFAGLPKPRLSPAEPSPSPRCQQLATASSKNALPGIGALKPRIDPVNAGRQRAALERLQEIFITDDFLDAAQVAKLLNALPKVKGAVILVEPGTILANELPRGFDPEAALAAPLLIRAARQFVQDLCQSNASAATILADLPISVFQEGSLSVLIVHEGRGLLPGLKERVSDVAKALDTIYGSGSGELGRAPAQSAVRFGESAAGCGRDSGAGIPGG